ncbi:MAG TPA: DUF3078 domain-containing protein [Flavisolibacter sp.]|nr:DUF3078 domain-containing protein [Flavisolibacter sp.]
MMKLLLTAVMLFALLPSQAQDETVKKLQADAGKTIDKAEDTTQRAWRKGGIANLNLSQGALSNWAAGGDKFSLSLNAIVSLYAFYKHEKSSWDNTLDFNLGYLNTTTLGSRKNDDRIDLLSKYGYSIGPKWNIAALANFRTQMLRGHTYPEDVKTFSSAFLSPAYVLGSLGFDFKPNSEFSLFLSPVTARWVIVKDDSLSAQGLYGVVPGRHSRSELGAFVTAAYIKELNKVVSYKGRLDLFSNYKNNPEKIDVFMSNILSVKLAKLLSATWNVDLIYDDDVRIFGDDGNSPALQLKSLVGIGLLVKL